MRRAIDRSLDDIAIRRSRALSPGKSVGSKMPRIGRSGKPSAKARNVTPASVGGSSGVTFWVRNEATVNPDIASM
jgi:hypothetical protein